MAERPPLRARLVQFARRRWVRGVFVAGVLVALLLSLLPYGIRYTLTRWMSQHGAQHALVRDVDFNPFTGRLAIHGLSVKADSESVLHIDHATLYIRWLPLWHRRLKLAKVLVEQANVTVESHRNHPLRVGGLLLGESGGKPPGSQWGLALNNVEVRQSAVRYITPDLSGTLQIDDARLSDLVAWRPTQPAWFSLRGHLNGAALQIRGKAEPFAGTRRFDAKLQLTGLALAPLAPLASPALSALAGTLDANVALDARQFGTGWAAKQTGTLAISGLAAQNQGRTMKVQRLGWAGTLNAHTTAGALFAGTADGELEGQGLQVGMPSRHLELTQAASHWSGQATTGPHLQLQGSYSAETTELRDTARSLPLARIGTLSIQDLNTQGGELQSALIHLQQVALAEPEAQPAVLAIQDARLDRVQLKSARSMRLDQLQLTGVNGYLHRNRDGGWATLEQLRELMPTPSKAKPGPPWSLNVGDAKAEGQIRVLDESVTPAYKGTLQVDSLQVSKIDTATPRQPSPIHFAGRLGEYSSLSLSGSISPFVSGISFDLNSKVKNLSLPPLSAYFVRLFGYSITSGQLDSTTDLKASHSVLDGNSRLLLKDLHITPANARKLKPLTSQLPVPLETALSLLRNASGNVNLDVPIRGDLRSPHFGLGNTINQAIGKAMERAAFNYLRFALQPFGAIVTIAQLAGRANRIRLKPVEFVAGQTTLPGTAQGYLARVAKIMKERPRLNIRVCGQATPSDRVALRESEKPKKSKREVTDQQLFALAEQRAAAVKNDLVSLYGINPGRLFICTPELTTEPTAAPGVELLI